MFHVERSRGPGRFQGSEDTPPRRVFHVEHLPEELLGTFHVEHCSAIGSKPDQTFHVEHSAVDRAQPSRVFHVEHLPEEPLGTFHVEHSPVGRAQPVQTFHVEQ